MITRIKTLILFEKICITCTDFQKFPLLALKNSNKTRKKYTPNQQKKMPPAKMFPFTRGKTESPSHEQLQKYTLHQTRAQKNGHKAPAKSYSSPPDARLPDILSPGVFYLKRSIPPPPPPLTSSSPLPRVLKTAAAKSRIGRRRSF